MSGVVGIRAVDEDGQGQEESIKGGEADLLVEILSSVGSVRLRLDVSLVVWERGLLKDNVEHKRCGLLVLETAVNQVRLTRLQLVGSCAHLQSRPPMFQHLTLVLPPDSMPDRWWNSGGLARRPVKLVVSSR